MSAQPACITPCAVPPAPSAVVHFSMRAALWLAGVILPLIALAVALFFLLVVGFDLPPTMIVPTLSIAAVPLANALLLRALGSARPAVSRRLGHWHGFAIGIGILLTLLLLPHTAAGVSGLRHFGGGLLLLAPLLSLLAALAMRRLLKAHVRLPAAWPGVLLALAIVAVPELPQAITQAGVHMATRDAPATRANGIRLLRALGSRQILLRLCDTGNDRLASLTDLVMLTSAGTTSGDAREAFYRLTGTSFDDLPDAMREAAG
ncbi:hypothetical protein F2P45_25115 [Massilia sp. CCM 8733]|uniref:HTH araC/xylS-type domain-containing protein n=1 Tax=Massilia mucilaginosa TaxID=2609282 RepID=A0ABX0NZ20_9BURK|nr:hypothetical protein [Massilia mucilaginosa]NHZ92259.1 hypothetical protein [Massilia mucilaginosa]